MISLVLINHKMASANTVRTTNTSFGLMFEFLDSSNHLYGQFRVEDPVSPAPKGTLGAVRTDDGWWYWVVKVDKKFVPPFVSIPKRNEHQVKNEDRKPRNQKAFKRRLLWCIEQLEQRLFESEKRIIELENQVKKLNDDNSPHRRAGYD